MADPVDASPREASPAGRDLRGGEMVRALRLPFTGASLMPFLFGYLLIGETPLAPWTLVVACLGVALTHLSANLANDLGDAQTGADKEDPTYYGFFGGSKLLQEGVAAKAYLRLALLLGLLGGLCACLVAVRVAAPEAIVVWVVATALAWGYSLPPLRLCYHRAGELSIFVLFGLGCVVGGAYVRLGSPPPMGTLLAALPLAFLVTAILVGNELPDRSTDAAVGKRTLVVWLGPRPGVFLFVALVTTAYISLALAVSLRNVPPAAMLGFVGVLPAVQAVRLLCAGPPDKQAFARISQLTIGSHALCSAGLILGVIL